MKQIAIILAMVIWLSFPVYALPVRIYGGDFDIPLLDRALTEAVIEIPDHFVIIDLDVRINITHTCVFDLHLMLQGPGEPSEQAVMCLNYYEFYEFFVGENYTQTIFDDEAQVSIEEGQPPFTGRFRPELGNLLAIFDGQDAFGSWHLQIYDRWPADTGTLDSFELIITVPEPTMVLLIGLGGLALLRRKRGYGA